MSVIKRLRVQILLKQRTQELRGIQQRCESMILFHTDVACITYVASPLSRFSAINCSLLSAVPHGGMHRKQEHGESLRILSVTGENSLYE